jgi:hypothetical protein
MITKRRNKAFLKTFTMSIGLSENAEFYKDFKTVGKVAKSHPR